MSGISPHQKKDPKKERKRRKKDQGLKSKKR
jgi:hypothetical protein